jgi:TonB family protein
VTRLPRSWFDRLSLMLRVMGAGVLVWALSGRSSHASVSDDAGAPPAEDVGAIVQLPTLIFRPPPVYPAQMQAERVTGTVLIKYDVDATGHVSNAVVARSTFPAFNEPALRAVLKWRFKPGTRDGVPCVFRMEIPIHFGSAGDDVGRPGFDTSGPNWGPFDNTAPAVINSLPIVYPYELERENVNGMAKTRMLLSDTGRVTRVEIVYCSRPEFGFALTAAAQGFVYTPATKGGKAVPSIVEIPQYFDPSEDAGSDAKRLLRLEGRKGQVHPVAELDAPPHPLSTRHPLYPLALEDKAITGDASVEFLIQEDGWVRLPRIVTASRPEFGYAAVEAVASWSFQPPMFHGKPTVARARVSFKFKPKKVGAPSP